MTYTSEYPIINVTVDVIVFIVGNKPSQTQILLIERKNDPFKGKLALPGGFINPDEDAPHAAARELKEETGLEVYPGNLVFIQARTAVDRDPRGRTISLVYDYVVNYSQELLDTIAAGDDAADIYFINQFDDKDKLIDNMAFDHWNILFEEH